MSTAAPEIDRVDSNSDNDALAPEFAWRVLRLVNIFRTLAAIFLIAMFLVTDSPHLIGDANPQLFFATALSYCVFGMLNDFAVTQRWPSLMYQSVAQSLADIVALVTMTHASGGLDSGLGNLLIVSVAAVALIWRRRRALLFGAMAAIAVIFEQYLSVLKGSATTTDLSQAGVLGGILLFISFAAHPLARRIQESEALARQRGIDLANLAQLNEYIIRNLRESIVVVDGEDRIRLMNEAAANYLGTSRTRRGVGLREISPRLMDCVTAWRSGQGYDNQTPTAIVAADGTTMINPYFAPIGHTQEGALLIFLEDASALAEKVQQSKLASLGRLSASIAHEIRNPVGAMSHAGQLLAESPALSEQEKKLTGMINTNAKRVSSIIDSVLQLSRREKTRPERLNLVEWVDHFVAEFLSTCQLPVDRIEVENSEAELDVRMDPGHLHQVLWNLCENALRYADPEDAGEKIEIAIGRRKSNRRPYMEIRDRGPGIRDDFRDRVFEPFFRGEEGENTGTGLGLFISRELCETNRAALVYEPRPGGGSIFRIIFADPMRWEH